MPPNNPMPKTTHDNPNILSAPPPGSVPRPCGHCGGKPVIYGSPQAKLGYYVACANRGCSARPSTTLHPTREGAIAEWNEETV